VAMMRMKKWSKKCPRLRNRKFRPSRIVSSRPAGARQAASLSAFRPVGLARPRHPIARFCQTPTERSRTCYRHSGLLLENGAENSSHNLSLDFKISDSFPECL
jgi:hypothetical protein